MAVIESAKQPGWNTEVTAFASAARTASPTPQEFSNHACRGVQVIIDVTLDPAAASVVFNINGIDKLSGKTYLLLASPAIVATGTTVLKIFPGADAAANLVANDFVPLNFEIAPVHADTDSITYSVDVNSMR